MQKGRKQNIGDPSVPSSTTYIDQAYNSYVHQEKKLFALKNRNKVLQLNEDHILKTFENNIIKLQKINHVKQFQKEKSQMLTTDKQKKQRSIEELKFINQHKRNQHQKQMSTISLTKNEQTSKLREDALKNRQENLKIIEKNRQSQHQMKKQHHNKIHQDLIQSRNTIKNFFHSKHDSIVKSNENQIKKLQIKKNKVSCQVQSQAVLDQKARHIAELKNKLKEERFEKDSLMTKSSFQTCGDAHPLVRRIEYVMSKYVKSN